MWCKPTACFTLKKDDRKRAVSSRRMFLELLTVLLAFTILSTFAFQTAAAQGTEVQNTNGQQSTPVLPPLIDGFISSNMGNATQNQINQIKAQDAKQLMYDQQVIQASNGSVLNTPAGAPQTDGNKSFALNSQTSSGYLAALNTVSPSTSVGWVGNPNAITGSTMDGNYADFYRWVYNHLRWGGIRQPAG